MRFVCLQIVQWIIDGRTYSAGQTVQLTGEGILTATAVVSDSGEKTFVETLEQTTTKTLYGYVKETDTRGSLNGGSAFADRLEGENAALPTIKVADTSKANAATGTIGTNMTEDSEAYEQYWP